ncbi:ABC transporter ATP-binding protein [Leucobacter chromiisoli]|nr:ABC transporter ATP-binding protein [Leucobacter chromiisoli]
MVQAIEVRNVTKTYGSGRGTITAVRDVSFALGRGESLGIIGESGSGKSTLSRLIMGLEQPDSGEIALFGTPLVERGRRSRKRRIERAKQIQIVFQDPLLALDPRQSPAESLEEILRMHGVGDRELRRRRSAEVFERVGLGAREIRTIPRFLSGGQRQRVAIARALCLDPEVLILDEAVAALDVSIQAQIMNLLVEIRESLGIAYLFITHDLAVVPYLAERLVVMRQGRIVESGPTSHVLTQPQHVYTRLLLESVPSREWDLARVRELRAEAARSRQDDDRTHAEKEKEEP